MSYRIEYAPNIRSRCSHCDQVILEGEIRITTGTQHWRVDCVSAQLLHAIYNSVRGRLHQLPGLMSLNKEDRKQVILLFQALSSSASNSRSSLSTLSAEWAHALRTADVEQATNTSSRHATLSLRSLSGSLPSPSASVSAPSSTTTSPATFTTSSYRHLHKRPLEVCSPLIDSPSLIHADSSSPTTPDIDIDSDIHLPSDPSSRTVSNSPFSWLHSNNNNPNAMSSDEDEGWTIQAPQKKRQRTHSIQMQIPTSSQSHAFQPIVPINTPSSTFGIITPTPHQHQHQQLLQPTSSLAFPPPLHPPPHPHCHPHPHVVSTPSQSIDADDEMRDNNENLQPSTSSSSSPSLPSFPHFPVSCFPQRPLPLSNPHFPSQSRTMFPT